MKEVLRNEKDVKAKIQELATNQPMSKADQDSLELRNQKVQIDIEDVVTRAKALATSLKKIKRC